jgi:hypothetical protein
LYQFERAFERYDINKNIKFDSIIPIHNLVLEIMTEESHIPLELNEFFQKRLNLHMEEEIELFESLDDLVKGKFAKETSTSLVIHCNICYYETLVYYAYCHKCKLHEKGRYILCLRCAKTHTLNLCKNPQQIKYYIKLHEEKKARILNPMLKPKIAMYKNRIYPNDDEIRIKKKRPPTVEKLETAPNKIEPSLVAESNSVTRQMEVEQPTSAPEFDDAFTKLREMLKEVNPEKGKRSADQKYVEKEKEKTDKQMNNIEALIVDCKNIGSPPHFDSKKKKLVSNEEHSKLVGADRGDYQIPKKFKKDSKSDDYNKSSSEMKSNSSESKSKTPVSAEKGTYLCYVVDFSFPETKPSASNSMLHQLISKPNDSAK